jgi:hypothetical protein
VLDFARGQQSPRDLDSKLKDQPHICPTCHGPNTAKCVESLLTQIHICRDCREPFIITKSTNVSPRSSVSAAFA